MAKKRDSKGDQNSTADRAYQSAIIDPRAFQEQGTSFAGEQSQQPTEGDIEAWEDEETAPDLFAMASDEDQMQARGGHTQRRDEEQKGGVPDTRRR